MADSVTKETFAFLKELENNNNRDWFNAHKTEFNAHQDETKMFFNLVLEDLNKHDQIEKMKMFRIYRDVRFSKDKSPYKTQFACSFSRAGVERRGGRFICLKPGETFIAAGFWAPNKDDLLRIRKELELDASEFRKVIGDNVFKGIWGELEGEAVKTAPKGFDKEHPDIDLIRQKQFIFVRSFSDKEVLSKGFAGQVDDSFRAITPYFDLMSSILTTNLNGESLIG
ncbi:DUF2461 domain-containing protein [uncultured Croceitalea sp.]|uniref:DUF2461 domain-containing protein n=1 Tax=uncultured Croceitalea sp. TaxID=1798908 RepID=UPI003306423D